MSVITVEDLAALRAFVPPLQLASMLEFGEEREFFFRKLAEIRQTTLTMHATYGSSAEGAEPRAWLHYFVAGYDAWIVERDALHAQLQTFGLARFHGIEPELGYISLPEIFSAGAEIDLHFQPMPLDELRRRLSNVESALAVPPDSKRATTA